jgi:aconitate hydratase
VNLTEKIIAAHLEGGTPRVNEEISLRVDQTLTQDIMGMLAYLAFETLGVKKVRTELSVSYIDHNLVYLDNKNPDDHAYLLSAAKKYGVILSRAGNGICHALHRDRFSVPGKVLIGSDSHTPSCGAMGMLGIGVGGLDVAAAMAGIPLTLRMPAVSGIRLEGSLRPGVSAKDLALAIVARIGCKGGTGKALEYWGPGLEGLSVSERFTIANMGAETGATCSLFPADKETRRFLASQGREHDFVPQEADKDAAFSESLCFNLDQIRPMVARPHQPDNAVPLEELPHIPVNQVFIGSCTNSSYADLKTAAMILKGHVVPGGVSLIISPGTRQNFRMLLEDGSIETFLLSGARILECGCGPCIGMGQAVQSGGVSLRTANRNFKGRCGTADSQVYLASPAVAAASAINGYISLPGMVPDPALLEPPGTPYINDNLFVFPEPRGALPGVEPELVRGPNIKPVPLGSPPDDHIECRVVICLGDNISTDEIAPTGPVYGAFRSNIPQASETAFIRIDPEFASRARAYGSSAIVGGENYGQGSSREHAAALPMYLGVKFVLAKSYARIHRSNLVNFGVVPLEFAEPSDWEKISQGDSFVLDGLRTLLNQGKGRLEWVSGEKSPRPSQGAIPVKGSFTLREQSILLAGGLLNFIRGAE